MNKKRIKKLTEFQKKVLKATLEIPVGETRSYKWMANKIGEPKAFRAVGQALRHNPYPLIIPCHRVIKEDGTLGAYAGRYSNKKRDLLKIEEEIKESLNIS